MAASLAMCGRCARKLQHLRINWPAALRPLCTAPPKSSSDEVDDKIDLQALFPSSKTRDPLAVLKALATTIQPMHFMPNPAFIEDNHLLPRNKQMQEQCFLAKKSGVEAAKFVISNCPEIFPLWNANSAWKTKGVKGVDVADVQTEDDLKILIKEESARKAAQAYERLKEQGVEVSLATQNELLDLVAYKLGEESVQESLTDEELVSEFLGVDEEDPSEEDPSEEDPSEEDPSVPDEGNSVDETTKQDVSQWKSGNYAEQLFESMTTKDGRTYEAMVLGLSKFRAYEEACDLFINGMRANGYQASLLTYNILLKGISRLLDTTKKWKLAQKIIKEMGEEPVVIPNLNTFNALLRTVSTSFADQEKKTKIVLSLIRDMKAIGIEPSLESYNQLLRVEYLPYWEKKREMRLKNEPLEKMYPNPAVLYLVVKHLESLPRLPPIEDPDDSFFFHSAMSAALICHDGHIAIRLYKLVENQNDTYYLGVKYSRFYSTFLVALSTAEVEFPVLYDYYNKIVPEKIRPRSFVYTTVLNLAYKTNHVEVAPKLYEDMRKNKVAITENVTKALIKALAAAEEPEALKKNLDIMLDVLRWMKIFDTRLAPETVNQVIRLYCVNDRLEDAFNALEYYDKTEFFPHFSSLFMILNLAVKLNDRSKVMRTFELFAKFGFAFNKQRRYRIYYYLNIPTIDRKRIDALFEDENFLKERRQKYEKRN